MGTKIESAARSLGRRLVDPSFVLADHRVSIPRQMSWRARYALLGHGAAVTRNDRRILAHKNSRRGERVWIIGNGPSIAGTDLSLLARETTIGTNSIFLNRDRMGFDPTHYVVEDYLVAEDRAAEIALIKGSTKWFGNYLGYCLPETDNTLWMNVSVDYRDTPDWPRFSTDLGRVVYVGGTVTYLCIQLAYYLGAAEVVLVGVDHSYVVDDDEPLEGNTITSTQADVNHFHPDYFGEGKRWHLPRVDRMERAYIRAREAFAADGRVLLNATKGGQLEVFPRVDYDQLAAR